MVGGGGRLVLGAGLALLSSRFDPRPEIFSLLLLAAFLAVLFRAEQRHVCSGCCLYCKWHGSMCMLCLFWGR